MRSATALALLAILTCLLGPLAGAREQDPEVSALAAKARLLGTDDVIDLFDGQSDPMLSGRVYVLHVKHLYWKVKSIGDVVRVARAGIALCLTKARDGTNCPSHSSRALGTCHGARVLTPRHEPNLQSAFIDGVCAVGRDPSGMPTRPSLLAGRIGT